jgi:HlyD family secretion protein
LSVKGRGRWWKWVVLAAALLAVTYYSVQSALGPRVPVVAASRRELVHRVVAIGRVLPPARINIGSTLLGTVQSVLVSEGSHVKAGQLLIQVRDREARAGLEQAKAGVEQASARLVLMRQVSSRLASESLRQAQTNLDQAEQQYQRMAQLQQSGAATQQQLDDAKHALDLARSQMQNAQTQADSTGPGGSDFRVSAASLSQARAALAGADARLAETRVEAPTDAVVLTRNVEPGDVVQPGRVLMVLARDGDTQLVVQPDEKNLAYLRIGQDALVSTDAYAAERFSAQVVYIAPSIDPDRGTVEVKLKVPAAPAYLRADMTVSVDIEVGRHAGALVVPAEAVRDAGTNHPWVMVIERGLAARRPVRLGVQGEGSAQILDGLRDGEWVIAPSAGPIAVGRRVRPASEASRAL